MGNAENSSDFAFLVISGPPNWEVDGHYRDLELFSTLSMAREFISDYADTNSGDRRVVPESLGKQRVSSEVRIRTFKKSR